AYLLFFGDILVTYALAGAVVFLFRGWGPRLLIGLGALGLAALVAKGLLEHAHYEQLRQAAEVPGASEAARKAWAQPSLMLAPPASFGKRESAGYRGDFIDSVRTRAFAAMLLQTVVMLSETLWEAIAQMMIGIGLYRLGFFTLGWRSRSYGLLIAA